MDKKNSWLGTVTDAPLAASLLSSEERQKAFAERHPLKRIGLPHEVAGLALHLPSDSGSWITGQIFHVDGGMSSLRVFK
jgi:NAD(P)-dependent dehydrogenase (short-subunit alcohol dehydrogenase family)